MTATVPPQATPNRIVQRRHDGVSIIRPTGAVDRELADDIRERTLEARSPVVIDLTDCVLTDTTSLRQVAVEWQLHQPPMCIVSPRATARQLLRRSGVDQHVPLFRSVEEAMEAEGWRRVVSQGDLNSVSRAEAQDPPPRRLSSRTVPV